MDPLVLVLLVVIVLAGGIIGVLADHLGRRIGKKKLSFRSMRPKHVARLGTFIAGTLVSLITILLVYSTSSGIREWITQGRAAIRHAHTLTDQNVRLESDITAKTQHIAELDSESRNARAHLNDATRKLVAIRQNLKQANEGLAAAKRRVAQGQLDLAKSRTALRRNQELLAQKQGELKKVAAHLEMAQRNYSEILRNFKSVSAQRDEANDEVIKDRGLVASLTKQQTSLQTAIDSLTSQRESLNNNLAVTKAELHSTQQQLITAKSQLETTEADLFAVEQKADLYRVLAANVRTSSLTYERGQEVARQRVAAHPSVRQAHDAIRALLRLASSNAQARGSGIRPNSESCVFLPEVREQDGHAVTSQEIEDEITQKLVDSDQEAILVATAETNSFKGEPLPLQIIAYHNPVIYHRGDVLGTLDIPRRLSMSAVWTRFNTFMSGPIHNRALGDHMIPALGHDDSLVNVEPTRTIDLLERMAHGDRAHQLLVVARGETRAADPLLLDFVIK